MTKTVTRIQRKIQTGVPGAGKRPADRAKTRLVPALSRRGEAVQPYWWILRGCRPDES